MSEKLFPEYLNKGSKGPAVAVLQVFLAGGCYGGDCQVFPNGVYDEATAVAVMNLQVDLAFEGNDVDGHFGPGTRARLKETLGIDMNAILADIFVGQTVAIVPV